MERIINQLNKPGSGLFLYLIVVVVLISLILINGLRSFKSQKKAEIYQHQLIAVCGAMDNAISDGYLVKAIRAKQYYGKDVIQIMGVAKAIDTEGVEREKEVEYVIFPDGEVWTHHTASWDTVDQKFNWSEFQKFVQFFKK